MTADSDQALIVMAKRPLPGLTKTRLAPSLSLEQAAHLYECFLRDTLDLMRQIPNTRRVLAYLPAAQAPYFAALAPDFERVLQEGEDLGARLDVLSCAFLSAGYRRVALIDSDSPTLPLEYIHQAFWALSGAADMALGPCEDGGYYLIGLKKPASRLFREVKMSTSQVTAQTLALAAEAGLRVHLLPSWYDVDEASGLARLGADLERLPSTTAHHTRQFFASSARAAFSSG